MQNQPVHAIQRCQAQGASVRENEQGVPFLFYNWNKYVHRNNPEQVISRDDYMKLYEEEQKII